MLAQECINNAFIVSVRIPAKIHTMGTLVSGGWASSKMTQESPKGVGCSFK